MEERPGINTRLQEVFTVHSSLFLVVYTSIIWCVPCVCAGRWVQRTQSYTFTENSEILKICVNEDGCYFWYHKHDFTLNDCLEHQKNCAPCMCFVNELFWVLGHGNVGIISEEFWQESNIHNLIHFNLLFIENFALVCLFYICFMLSVKLIYILYIILPIVYKPTNTTLFQSCQTGGKHDKEV